MTTPNTPFFDKKTLDETISRIRDLNEKLIGVAKNAGQISLDAYANTLQSLVEFEEQAASRSQLDWVSALANAHAKFVQDISGSYLKAAREVLN